MGEYNHHDLRLLDQIQLRDIFKLASFGQPFTLSLPSTLAAASNIILAINY